MLDSICVLVDFPFLVDDCRGEASPKSGWEPRFCSLIMDHQYFEKRRVEKNT